MADPTRPNTYFVTTVTANRRRLFQAALPAKLLIETLQHYRREQHYKLHAYIVMPDHLHLLLTPLENSLERVIGLIKGGFSFRLHAQSAVWQQGFIERRIRDRDEYEIKRDYIHKNPVRAHLVTQTDRYPYSSAYRPPTQNQPGRSGLQP